MKSQKFSELGVWGLKLYLGHLGQKDISGDKFRTLAPIFQNSGLFYPEP